MDDGDFKALAISLVVMFGVVTLYAVFGL